MRYYAKFDTNPWFDFFIEHFDLSGTSLLLVADQGSKLNQRRHNSYNHVEFIKILLSNRQINNNNSSQNPCQPTL